MPRMFAGLGSRLKERRAARQERQVNHLKDKLAKVQATSPGNTKKIAKLEQRIARKEQRMERKKNGVPGIQQPGLVGPAGAPLATAILAKGSPAPLPRYPEGTGTPPANWDEKAYLAKHADVAAGVASDVIPSGLWHYMASGQHEGRDLSGWENLLEPGNLMWAGLGVATLVVAYKWYKSR